MPPTDAQNRKIIDALVGAYNAELETVMNYIANGTDLDGVRAEQIKKSLLADVVEEFTHAQRLARRIKTIGGVVPGSQSLEWRQSYLQPPDKTTNVVKVIKGVIEAEEDAIKGYERIIELTDRVDYATQDLAIELMADEQEHRREFVGFLKEYEQGAEG